MIVVALVLAGLAAALHVFIFWLESVAWRTPRARAVFGTTPEQAEATEEMAFNQGFYNLFLAIAVAVGIVLVAIGQTAIGATLIFVGTGSMVAAALVLVLRSSSRASAALKQGLFPTLAVIALVIGLAIS